MDAKTLEFIKLFNQLEEEMGIETHTKYEKDSFNRTTFLKKLEALCDEQPKYSFFRSELEELSELRNVIIYEYKQDVELGIPSGWAISKLKEILDKLKNPQTAYAIASKPVETCGLDWLLSDVIQNMGERKFTHVPVVDKEGKFVGVISESVVVQWTSECLRSKVKEKMAKETKVQDIMSLIKEPITNYWAFVPMKADGYSILKLFQDYIDRNQRLGVIFVTRNGKNDEKIMGIITAWDLGRIER